MEEIDDDKYSTYACESAVDTLLKAEGIKADSKMIQKIAPMIADRKAAIDKLDSKTVDSSKGIDGLKETANKRLKELSDET